MLGSILIVVGIGLIVGALFLRVVLPLIMRAKEGVNRISMPATLATILVGAVLAAFNSVAFYAEPGYSYLVQYPDGTQLGILTPGYHLRLFGNLIPFKKVLTVKFSSESDRGLYTGLQPPIQIRFNDAVIAEVEIAARFRLPDTPAEFKKVALDFRTQENLVNASLIPTIREVVRNSGRMLSAQEYIVGRGGEFENAVLDQLEDGIYILETRVKRSEVSQEITRPEDRQIQRGEVVRYEVMQRVDKEGNLVRKRHPLVDYSLKVVQATVERVDPEPKFKELLSKQRDAAAQASVEQEQAKKAEFEKQRIIAEGEAEKASIQVTQEKEQIQILITEETQMKEEAIRVQKTELELERAKLEAAAVRVKAEAESYARRAMMQADNALDKRLEALVQINRAYAEALKDKNLVPQVVVGSDGRSSNSAMDLVSLLMAKTAKDLGVAMQAK